jgi:hypothetical protein
MKSIKYEQIEKQYNGWVDYYKDNKASGKKMMDFVIANNQWDDDIVTARTNKNQESLTFNQIIKHLRRAHTQLGEIEFTLNIAATNDKYQNNVTEQTAFRLVLNSILLSDDALNKFNEAGKKCLNYGWAFAEINFKYEDDETCNLIPNIIIHKDPSIAFWDKNAMHPTKVDGRFCGFCRTLSKDELEEAYPALKKVGWLSASENKVYDYWWRNYKEVEYVTLYSGIQKRLDLLTPDEKSEIDKKAPIKTREICEIYFQRCCKGRILEKPRRFPLQDLPLVYHPGMTEWQPEKGEITLPYGLYMEGAQKLHNYSLSQVASQSKSLTGDKWLFESKHVQTQSQREAAKEINSRDGGFVFGPDIGTIRREQPAQISQTIVEVAGVTKQEIDEINGAMIDTQNAQQTVIAAKALDKITHNSEAINMYFMEGHIIFVNQIGKLFRQMIPELYTQERALLIKKKDGSGETIIVNQDAGTGYLINNIKDINNNFHYEISAGPSSTMQKENTVKYLLEAYNIPPQNPFFMATAHIFFRNLQTKDAAELERIAVALGDENLIKYAEGEMTMDEYKQAKAQQMQKQMEQQAEMAKNDPQAQGMIAAAQAETEKAKAMQFDSQTKRIAEANKTQTDRMKLMQDAKNEMAKLQLEITKIQSQQSIAQANNDIELLQKRLDANQQIIETMHKQQELDMAQQAQNNADSATTETKSSVY